MVWWRLGVAFQRCDVIVKRGCNLPIAIGSVMRSGKPVRVDGFAKCDPDPTSAWPPGPTRKGFEASLDSDRNHRDWVCRQNQSDSRLKRLERPVPGPSPLGKPHQILTAREGCRAQGKIRKRAAALIYRQDLSRAADEAHDGVAKHDPGPAAPAGPVQGTYGQGGKDRRRIEQTDMVGRHDPGTFRGNPLDSVDFEMKYRPHEQPVEESQ